MQRVPVADIGHGPQQYRIPLEGSIANREVDPGQVLVDDPAGDDVEVANLGVPLLALRQTDGLAGRGQYRVRPSFPERIPVRLPRGGDRIAGGLFTITPAVDDHQDERWAAYTRCDCTTSTVACTIWVKSVSFRLAPPTRAPSISGCSIRLRALAGVTLPP